MKFALIEILPKINSSNPIQEVKRIKQNRAYKPQTQINTW